MDAKETQEFETLSSMENGATRDPMQYVQQAFKAAFLEPTNRGEFDAFYESLRHHGVDPQAHLQKKIEEWSAATEEQQDAAAKAVAAKLMDYNYAKNMYADAQQYHLMDNDVDAMRRMFANLGKAAPVATEDLSIEERIYVGKLTKMMERACAKGYLNPKKIQMPHEPNWTRDKDGKQGVINGGTAL